MLPCRGLTVTVAVPDFPSIVALMIATPIAIPVTTPPSEMLATDGADDCHATDRLVSGLPTSPLAIVVSWIVSPATSEKTPGTTATDSTVDDGPNVSTSLHAANNSMARATFESPEILCISDSQRTSDGRSAEDSADRHHQ